jgi:hypothetical protein
MKEKPKISFLVFSLAFLLLFAETLRADLMKHIENLRGDFVLLPLSAPEKSQLVLASFDTLARRAEIIGALASYDDPRTKRPVDYLELYDRTGALLLISWVDRFGIRRTAVDHALLHGDASEPKGVLVLLLEGTLL